MGLQKCKECGNDVSTQAKSCPKCGAVIKKNSGRLFALVFLATLSVIGVISSNQHSQPVVSAAVNSSRSDLEVINYAFASGQFGNDVIQGTIRNNTGRQYKYVQVEINLYDKSGVQIGSTLANVNNLEPNGTWKFEAPLLNGGASTVRIKAVTGW